MRFRPAQAYPNSQITFFCSLINGTWIACNIKTWDTNRASCTSYFHSSIKYCGRMFMAAIGTMSVGFKSNTVYRSVYFRYPYYFSNLVRQTCIFSQVYDFTTEALGLRQSIRNQISYNDYRST